MWRRLANDKLSDVARRADSVRWAKFDGDQLGRLRSLRGWQLDRFAARREPHVPLHACRRFVTVRFRRSTDTLTLTYSYVPLLGNV